MSKRYFIFPIIIIIAFQLISCTAGMIAPGKGVTEQFFKTTNDEIQNLNKYDFSRLKNGYGLVVFSYEFSGESGNKIVGFKEQMKEGIRVWEYKFDKADWEEKYDKKKIMFWGYRSFTTLFLLKNGYYTHALFTFRKGRIVYGGKLIIHVGNDIYIEVDSDFDKDFGSWIEEHKKKIEGIKIDTVLIQKG